MKTSKTLSKINYPAQVNKVKFSLSNKKNYDCLEDPFLTRYFQRNGKQKDLHRILEQENETLKTAKSLQKKKSF